VTAAGLRRPATRVAGDGGVPARRAVLRWAWRVFRREWRQQILVLALLSVAVAAVIAGTTLAYNSASASLDGDFGTADHLIKYDGSDPGLEANVDAVKKSFGTIEVIAHRFVPVPGSVETVDLRAQDPQGVYGAPMLALREGRYPTGAGEVAVTDGVAKTFELAVGDPLALDGRDWTVVGLVENPSQLDDEFALVSPSHADPPSSVTILFDASPAQFDSFIQARGSPPDFGSRGQEATVAASLLGLATVVLLLVCLVAAAGFTVVARRRQRQLGMLAAIGATEKHLRLVMVANGALVGVIAAVIGTSAGLVCWIAVAPQLETAVQHRIDRLSMPWGLVGSGILLAVVTATAAAWWPSRAVARIPITMAISGRPPRPRPAHRSAAVAGFLIAIGVVCLALAKPSSSSLTDPNEFRYAADATAPNAPLVISGTLATTLGVLLISPLAIRLLTTRGARWPIGVRLALRDLGRYQARSAAALAAISLALGIAATIVISATAAQPTAGEGNLPDRQLLVSIGDLGGLARDHVAERTPAELQTLSAQIERLAAPLDPPAVIALDMAVDPAARPGPGEGGSEGGRPAVSLGNDQGLLFPLYVATPELLEHYGLDPGAVDLGTDVLTPQTGEKFEFVNIPAREVYAKVQTIDVPGYSSLPTSLITPDALRRYGWERVRKGWLVEAGRPLTAAQLAAARDVAATAGLTIEARDDQHSLSDLGSGAMAAGMLLALSILAMTVGLIRSEAAGDLRTLTAAGATSTIRRTLTAATAGALALLGVILGTVGAYIALIAWHRSDIGTLSRVPVLQIVVITAGLPLLAGVASWLLAGREPPSLARKAPQ
jgi:putative ABC transport system permease protein